jgi:hypothetical protein
MAPLPNQQPLADHGLVSSSPPTAATCSTWHHNPTVFLDKYAKRLHIWRHLPVSLATLHQTFKRAGLRLKHVQKLATERCPIKRAGFVRRIGQYPTPSLVFLDEVSKDDRTYARVWGRAPAGTRVEKHNPFVRKRRFSMLSALALDHGIIASRVVEGSFRSDTFLEYLRDDLVGHSAFLSSFCLTLHDTSYPLCIPIPARAVSLYLTTHPSITRMRLSDWCRDSVSRT